MDRILRYLRHLYLDDLLYGLVGGLIGALMGVYLGNESFFQVGLFTLVGMVFSCYMVASQRMNSGDKDT